MANEPPKAKRPRLSCFPIPSRRATRWFCCGNQSAAEAMEATEAKPRESEVKPKKKPRPKNSYLKVMLDDDTMDCLHEIAVKLQQDIQSMSEEDDGATQDEKESKEETTPTSRRRALKFKPRSRQALHMTFFFGGQVLCELPPDELVEWHTNVQARLAKSNFVTNTNYSPDEQAMLSSATENDVTEDPTEETDDWYFTIRKISLFPPRRNYLIVAVLDASPPWHALYDNVRDIARNGDSALLRSVTQRSKDLWIPHITLGNLYGGRKADYKALESVIENFSQEVGTNEPGSGEKKISASCISMGGPVPSQVELDWNFYSRHKT